MFMMTTGKLPGLGSLARRAEWARDNFRHVLEANSKKPLEVVKCIRISIFDYSPEKLVIISSPIALFNGDPMLASKTLIGVRNFLC